MGSYGPRDALREPFEGYPAYGALHEVSLSRDLSKFMYSFRQIADDVFDVGSDVLRIEGFNQVPETDSDYDARKFYRSFDIESLSVSVLEMDPSERTAKKIHKLWERQDYGAVAQEARTNIDRSVGAPQSRMKFCLNRADGVGGKLPIPGIEDVRKKLALLPDVTQHEETFKTIEDEAYWILDAVNRRLEQQVVYPWDITPHVTFAAFRPEAQPKQICQVIEKTNDYLQENPLTISLQALKFRYRAMR